MPDAVDTRSPTMPFSPASAISVEEVGRRLTAFERTRDPAELWPGLSEADRVAAAREIERVTTEVLAGTRGVQLDPLAQHSAYALGVAGNTTGMGALIGRWIETRVVFAGDEVAEVFAEHLISGRSRAARLEREVLPAIDNLIARGITPTMLKGFHTARAYFDEPGMRPMSDVDILVGPHEVGAAEGALADAGFCPITPALRPYKRDWLGPGVDERIFSVERYDARTKWTLELHASLDRLYHPGATAHLDAERSLIPFEVGGRPVRALSPAVLVVYLACHCSQELDTIRLVRIFELVNVIRIE
ncbi:MAG TPA: nucleotidyltransferase family protein, partial [Gemmatimonadaceae bacterium]